MTIAELLIAAALTLSLMAVALGLTEPAQTIVGVQLEVSEMQQRMRIGADALAKDLLMAGLPVMPYRVGQRRSDPEQGVFYRPDAITLLSIPEEDETAESHTYYLKGEPLTATFQLMHYDGAQTDMPVVDHVVALAFEYFAAGDLRLDPAALVDGPWFPDEADGHRFDADLLDIRRVRVTLRVQAARDALRGSAGVLFVHAGTGARRRNVPDREIRFDVSPRNLSHE